ncbi:MAG: division/cell wall cluster transcriptional repressor MraZ [Porticoccaceae bacterium]|jgi:MraZ protein|nr:division/cell wall cluster transcriptional repressor MraZ [Porticoccaceae bacterium]
MFRGIHSVNMDAKGRLAIPAKFRELLNGASEGQLVITIDPVARCLAVYPLPQWEEIQAKIEKLPSLNPNAKRMQRLFIGHASDCELDANGRFLIPPPLRAYASLEKKLVLLGQGQKVEIWSDELWQSQLTSMLEDSDGMESLPEEMQSLSF